MRELVLEKKLLLLLILRGVEDRIFCLYHLVNYDRETGGVRYETCYSNVSMPQHHKSSFTIMLPLLPGRGADRERDGVLLKSCFSCVA